MRTLLRTVTISDFWAQTTTCSTELHISHFAEQHEASAGILQRVIEELYSIHPNLRLICFGMGEDLNAYKRETWEA